MIFLSTLSYMLLTELYPLILRFDAFRIGKDDLAFEFYYIGFTLIFEKALLKLFFTFSFSLLPKAEFNSLFLVLVTLIVLMVIVGLLLNVRSVSKL